MKRIVAKFAVICHNYPKLILEVIPKVINKTTGTKKAACATFLLERVELCCIFSQQFIWYLYKEEAMTCGYSTRVADNEVKIPNGRCPSDSF